VNQIAQLLPEANILLDLEATSKKRLFEQVGQLFEDQAQIARSVVFDSLFAREKLGSTAVGNGVAIPHGKMPNLARLFGLFARLDRPIDFEALDGQPVDLIFLLLAPEGAGADHLKALARVARLLRDTTVAHNLRASHDVESIYAVLAMPSASAA